VKPIPPPPVAGKTEWERFNNAIRKVLEQPKYSVKSEAKPQPNPKKQG
jgi:hypothetical protein